MRELKSYGQAVLVAAVLSTLASCSTSPEADFRDARVQIAQERAGFEARRDPGALLAKAAENARSKDEIIRYNRTYGNFALEHGKSAEAYVAFERAALAGDPSSGRKLAKGHYDGIYRPSNTTLVARSVYLPLTNDKSEVTVRLLLAKLIDDGQLSAGQFGSADTWLNQAASAGGTPALRKLAERAEAAGNLKLALDYYTKADKTSQADRALRQARVSYLGQETKPDVKRGHAWMEIARKLDKQGAAQLAARIYRQTSGGRDGAYLATVASAGGVNVMSQSQLVSAFRAAKTVAEREKIVQPLKAAAKAGNAEAAFNLAQLYLGIGGDPAEAGPLLATAYKKGKSEAMTPMVAMLMRAEPGQAYAEPLFKAVTAAADGGNVEAARALSSLYGIGGYKPANEEERLKWLRKAAESGDTKSQYEVGVYLYENGKTEAQKKLAVEYLVTAAKKGDAFARAYLKSKNLAEN